MIFLFSDFGAEGPYTGQVKAAIRCVADDIEVIDLLSNAPAGDPESAAYLLAALVAYLPPACVVLGVVDPGVGGRRDPVVVHADRRWFVGPDNGLFDHVARQVDSATWYVVDWRPERLCATFHGRDLFAPVAARIAQHDFSWAHHQRPAPGLARRAPDSDRIIYFDHYGNAYTGRRYEPALAGKRLLVKQSRLAEATTFCEVPTGTAFWYRNSIGLVEIAVNRGTARLDLGLEVGTPIRFVD